MKKLLILLGFILAITTLTACSFGTKSGNKVMIDPSQGTGHLVITFAANENAPTTNLGVDCSDEAGFCQSFFNDDLAPTQPDVSCTQNYGGPEVVNVSGMVNGKAVTQEFSRENGCEIARYEAMSKLVKKFHPTFNVSSDS